MVALVPDVGGQVPDVGQVRAVRELDKIPHQPWHGSGCGHRRAGGGRCCSDDGRCRSDHGRCHSDDSGCCSDEGHCRSNDGRHCRASDDQCTGNGLGWLGVGVLLSGGLLLE